MARASESLSWGPSVPITGGQHIPATWSFSPSQLRAQVYRWPTSTRQPEPQSCSVGDQVCPRPLVTYMCRLETQFSSVGRPSFLGPPSLRNVNLRCECQMSSSNATADANCKSKLCLLRSVDRWKHNTASFPCWALGAWHSAFYTQENDSMQKFQPGNESWCLYLFRFRGAKPSCWKLNVSCVSCASGCFPRV